MAILKFLFYVNLNLLLMSCISEIDIEALNGSHSNTSTLSLSNHAKLLDLGNSNDGGNSCAINSSGSLFCWGINYDSDDSITGLLGTNDTSSSTYNTAQAVDSGEAYESITMGEVVSCGITEAGIIKCWGKANYNGNTFTTYVPTLVDDSSSDTYISIHSGSYHTCAINTSKELKCFGDSWGSKLAKSTTDYAVTISDEGTLYAQIALGRNHTCGITTEGKLRCFGYNNNGQQALGSADNSGYDPHNIDEENDYIFVSAQEDTTCAITSNNVLKCWGSNSYGQIGDGTTTSTGLPVIVDSGTKYKKVDVGSWHVCGITEDDQIKCWGRNNGGQIGIGSASTYEATPTLIDSTNTYKEISAGIYHSCGLRTNGDLYCWGANGSGQLGLGNNTDYSSPQLVEAGFN